MLLGIIFYTFELTMPLNKFFDFLCHQSRQMWRKTSILMSRLRGILNGVHS